VLFEGHRYLTGMEIAAKLEVAKSRAAVILNSLEEQGYVQKIVAPNDARVKLVSLTPKGQRKVREIEGFTFRLHRTLLGNIESSNRSNVISALETLRSAMQEAKGHL
jgi:DNA-binding MarR family transcriptional regulator